MKRRITSIALVVILVLLLVAGYFMNLGAFLASAATLGNLVYSLVYLSIWVLMMCFGVKTKVKVLLNLWVIYWLLAVVFFALYMPAVQSSFAILFLFGTLVFLFPMIGFDYLLNVVNRNILGIDALYGIFASIMFLLVVSFVMLLLGLFVKRKLGGS